jgi:hypothetical protein
MDLPKDDSLLQTFVCCFPDTIKNAEPSSDELGATPILLIVHDARQQFVMIARCTIFEDV